MTANPEIKKLADDGKLAFEAGNYALAVNLFENAAKGYASLNDTLNEAEMKNNLSVALLKLGKAQEALDAANGTDAVFAQARDLKRQGMAVGNQASALEALHRFDEALAAYEKSARLFADAGEAGLRSMVLKSAAGVKLKRGKVTDSAIQMIGSLEAKDKPSIFERILRFFIRLVVR